MTDSNVTNQAQETPATDNKANSKEMNFRALEQKLAQERAARLEMEKELQRLNQVKQQALQDDDDTNDEPYVDHKRLNKTLNKFGQQTQSEIQKGMEQAKHAAKEELKREMWLEQHTDFYDTLQKAEIFAQRAPKLAESILQMPDGFERQKLVYNNIKALGLDRDAPKEPSIQDKIDANRRSPYYQPSGVGAAPYSQVGDFSSAGQKNAYTKMQELKNRLRI